MPRSLASFSHSQCHEMSHLMQIEALSTMLESWFQMMHYDLSNVINLNQTWPLDAYGIKLGYKIVASLTFGDLVSSKAWKLASHPPFKRHVTTAAAAAVVVAAAAVVVAAAVVAVVDVAAAVVAADNWFWVWLTSSRSMQQARVDQLINPLWPTPLNRFRIGHEKFTK